MTLPLTALYAPGDRPDRVAKALTSGADVVIVDLEDAVAPSSKARARDGLAAFAGHDAQVGPALQVRVNAVGSDWSDDDLAALTDLPLHIGVRVPKVESAAAVHAIAGLLPGRGIHALVESALGVERAFEIASAGVESIALGEADLRSQLGLPRGREGEQGLQWARSRLVYAAAAAGIAAPMMSVYADIADTAGLAASCQAGRALGFVGRTAIHPAQLPVIESAFTPSQDDVERAREVIARVGAAAADGVGTVVLADGAFLDVAMVQSARRTLALADRTR
ncbi:citrate lyase subunit beta [Microbacterium sp. Root166]|uniref:HpcH/HpaI aldolase/citrate lyase family protein n=1 Tax=Microbacterium sp. Root166 TaxID=1736478 RepID=UPI0006F8AD8D|nr:CoA ester lyase [Microbacterium sp. Root166]KQZ86136.1 citrate lyase subunit beta [Microbacterium sp. Root166]